MTVTDGRPRALQFFRSATATRPQTDLKRVESGYDTTPIANGIITTGEDGSYPEFAGPDDLTSLWMQVVSGPGGRTKLDSTGQVLFTPTYAPADSPVFTGNPTAPTPSPGDNDASISTTGFVKAAVDAATAALPGAYLQMGQTMVDVEAYGGSITAAIAARGPGKLYHLTRPVHTASSDVVLGYGTVLQGPGSSADCTIALSGTARIVTDGYDALVGTNPQVSPGVGGFALRHLTVEGGGGVRVYGYAYKIDDLNIRGVNTWGFRSEWTNNDSPIPPIASMEADIRDIRVHHCALGIYFDGPHDSRGSGWQSHFNSGGVGIVMGPKSNGTHVDGGHVYGVDHTMSMQMLSSGMNIQNMVLEGANGPQLEIRKAGSKFEGRIFSAQGNENVKGIVMGASGDGAAGCIVNATIENCYSGALDVTNDVGGCLYDIAVNSPSGVAVVGSMPPNSLARMTLLGGITHNGWNEPWLQGSPHVSGNIDVLGNIVAAYGTLRAEIAGNGSTLGLTSITTGSVANPNAGAWKLYLLPGTTGGTVKLVARGASGTVTTILDNIPA